VRGTPHFSTTANDCKGWRARGTTTSAMCHGPFGSRSAATGKRSSLSTRNTPGDSSFASRAASPSWFRRSARARHIGRLSPSASAPAEPGMRKDAGLRRRQHGSTWPVACSFAEATGMVGGRRSFGSGAISHSRRSRWSRHDRTGSRCRRSARTTLPARVVCHAGSRPIRAAARGLRPR
jgi:hypothetical protein